MAAASWLRPMAVSSASSKLWLPSEMRLTPATRSARSCSASTSPGLASTVISSSARPDWNVSRTAWITRATAVGRHNPGVPPPK